MITNFSLTKLRKKCLARKIPIISMNTQKFIHKTLNINKPINCLEIGSAIGYSSFVIANQIKKWDGNLISIELSTPAYKEALYNLYTFQSHLLTNLKFYNFDFKFININKFYINNFDFVFIDATKKHYLKYFQKIIPYLNIGSIIIFDDTIKFQNKLSNLYRFLNKNQFNYHTFQLDTDDGITVTISGK